MRKRWFFVPLLVGALVLGTVGGIVLAQEAGSGTGKTFAGRVAAILGLDEAKVQGAMDQAAREMQDEGLKAKLDAMVAAGRITQAQADEYLKWYQSRPNSLSPGRPFGGFRGGHMKGGRGWHMWGGGMGIPQAPPSVNPTPGVSSN